MAFDPPSAKIVYHFTNNAENCHINDIFYNADIDADGFLMPPVPSLHLFQNLVYALSKGRWIHNAVKKNEKWKEN